MVEAVTGIRRELEHRRSARPDDDVVIDQPGDLTVTHSNGTHSVRSVQSQESFVLSGGSLSSPTPFRSITPSLFQGNSSPRNNPSGHQWSRHYRDGFARHVDGVTINGDLDLTSYGAQVTIVNGLTLNGTISVGSQTARTIKESFVFAGTQTLRATARWCWEANGYNDLLLFGCTTLTLGRTSRCGRQTVVCLMTVATHRTYS